MANEGQPGRAIGIGSVVFGKHATYDIFVERNAKGMRDLLGDAEAAEVGIAAFQLIDRGNEVCGRTLGAWLTSLG